MLVLCRCCLWFSTISRWDLTILSAAPMRMEFTIIIALLCWMICGSCARSVERNHEPRQKFTIEELFATKFPHSISNDLDLDVCKAGKNCWAITKYNMLYSPTHPPSFERLILCCGNFFRENYNIASIYRFVKQFVVIIIKNVLNFFVILSSLHFTRTI